MSEESKVDHSDQVSPSEGEQPIQKDEDPTAELLVLGPVAEAPQLADIGQLTQEEREQLQELGAELDGTATDEYPPEMIEEELRKMGLDPEKVGERGRQLARETLSKFDRDLSQSLGEAADNLDDAGREMIERVRRERMARTVLEAQAGLEVGWPHQYIPSREKLPPEWEEHEHSFDHRAWNIVETTEFKHRKGPKRGQTETVKTPRLHVTMAGALERDGKPWIRIAISQRKGYPHWRDIKMVKSYLLGPEAWAYLVMPPETDQSSAGTVMHVFHCLETEKPGGQYLPDFTGGTGIV